MVWLYLGILALGIALLAGASEIAISNLLIISEKRRLRKSVLSFLLIAVSTSLPELTVALNAIALGEMSVSLGDILGSNIANVALILGVSFILGGFTSMRGQKVVLKEQDKSEFRIGLIVVDITLLLLLYLQFAGRFVGFMMVGVFFIYSYKIFQQRREEAAESSEGLSTNVLRESALAVGGILGVVLGARLTVTAAVDLATFFGVPSSIIGATLIAVGTSLPELTVNIKAAYRGLLEIVIGNIIGSTFFNSTLILGVLLIFTPFRVNILVLSDLILFSLVSNLIFSYLMETGHMRRRGGLILIAVYIVSLLSLLGILVLRAP